MTLHMVKLVPDMPRLIRWAQGQHLLHPRGDDDLGYALHAALRAGFADMAPKPFALMTERGRSPELLGYSAHGADELRDHAMAFADPDVTTALGLTGLAGKPMPDGFAQGRRLGFRVRVRPTIRTDRNGDRTKVAERDAYRETPEVSDPGPTRAEVYQAWLTARLKAGGAMVEQLTLESLQRSITLRRDSARRLRPLDGPDAGFSGVLIIEESASFIGLLGHGVGRHAAFGYGMLLLRPA